MQHHKYSLTELEDMMPWEREIYVSLLIDYIKKENYANIVEEMSEVIYIVAINAGPKLKLFKEEWSQIIRRITHVSTLKPKTEPSISNKTIFKHMDMLAALKKV